MTHLRERTGSAPSVKLSSLLVNDEPEAVHVNTAPTLELVLLVDLEPGLLVHVDAVDRGASEEEGEVERVSVVGRDDGRLGFSDVLKEASDRGGL